MSQQQSRRDRLVDLRRDLHRHPEPAWREFYTTARIVDELERVGVDELYVGPEVLADERRNVPDEDELDAWLERAREAGAREDILEQVQGGWTGAVAVVRQGEGPTVGLRVDIDGLPREESDDEDHLPAAEGFRSENEGAMHACGHDAHITLGIGVIEAIKESDFAGTLKVFFQPAEEVVSGGRPMAESGHLDDVDYLLATHVGLNHPTGEVVAGVEGILAVTSWVATFEGEPAHAGGQPNEGRNAVHAAATAVENLYGIPRHEDGATRVNAGVVEGGSAHNIIAEEARIEGEVRGATSELCDYMEERARQVLEGAAHTHGCEVEFEVTGGAPSAPSDDALIDVVADVAGGVDGVDSVMRTDDLGGSEDATELMLRVQENGGLATYVGVGTDHPGGHHTSAFDVDEDSLPIGVDVLAGAIREVARRQP